MLRAILGVIVGYIVMGVLVFVAFTGLLLGLGTNGVFEPDSYVPSILFLALAVVIGIVAAIIGGLICGVIGHSSTAVKVFAGIVLVVGLIAGGMELTKPMPGPRAGT